MSFNVKLLSLAIGLVGTLPAYATTTTFSSSAAFLSGIGSSVTDDYENPNYQFIQSDAQMDSVLGETRYTTTGFTDLDIIEGSSQQGHNYCAGCNGTFILDFSDTSVGTSAGVYGVGFDYANYGQPSFTALVTFGDGSTTDYALAPYYGNYFGIQSTLAVQSIYVGVSGTATEQGGLYIDNLTIGAPGTAGGVPEPATWTMMLVGFGLVGFAARRRPNRAGLGAQIA